MSDIEIIQDFIEEMRSFELSKDTVEIVNALEDILVELEQDKKRIKKIEQENRIQRRQLNSAFDKGWIPKEKVKELIKDETINISGFECIAVEDIEKLVEDK